VVDDRFADTPATIDDRCSRQSVARSLTKEHNRRAKMALRDARERTALADSRPLGLDPGPTPARAC
jgi:hypothetical protein